MGTETATVYVCDICGHRSTDPLERGSSAHAHLTVTARGRGGDIGGANLAQWWCGACWTAFCHWRRMRRPQPDADAAPTDELVWTDFADVPPGTLVSCDNDFLWLLRTKNGGWWVERGLPKDEIAALKDQRDGWGITPSINRAGPFRFKAHV